MIDARPSEEILLGAEMLTDETLSFEGFLAVAAAAAGAVDERVCGRSLWLELPDEIGENGDRLLGRISVGWHREPGKAQEPREPQVLTAICWSTRIPHEGRAEQECLAISYSIGEGGGLSLAVGGLAGLYRVGCRQGESVDAPSDDQKEDIRSRVAQAFVARSEKWVAVGASTLDN